MARHKHKSETSVAETAESLPHLLSLAQSLSVGLLACALILRLFLPGLTVEIGENAVVWVLAWGAFLFATLHFWKELHVTALIPTLSGVPLAFLAISFASIWWADDRSQAFYQSMVWCSDVLIFFTVCYWSTHSQMASRLISILLSCFVIEILYAVFQYFILLPATRSHVAHNSSILYQLELSPGVVPLLLTKLNVQQAFGHFTLPNSLAGYIIMFLPLLAILAIHGHSLKRKLFLVAVLAMAGWALWLSRSRSGMLCLLAIMVIWGGYWAFSHLGKRWLLGISGLILLAGSTFAYLALYTHMLDKIGRSGHTMLMRLGYWGAAGKIWYDHPYLGVGLGNFPTYYYTYKFPWIEEVNKAHNCYLQWVTETGLLGVAMLVWAGIVLAGVLRARSPKLSVANPGPSVTPEMAMFSCSLLVFVAAVMAFTLLAVSGRWIETEVILSYFLPSASEVATLASFLYYLLVPVFGLLVLGLFQVWSRWGEALLSSTGLKYGLLAFALHNALDIDFYEPALSHLAWVFLALLLAGLPRALRQYFPAQSTATAFLLLVCLGTMGTTLVLVPRLLNAAYIKRALPPLAYRLQQDRASEQTRKAAALYENCLAEGLRLVPADNTFNEAKALWELDKAQMLVSYLCTTGMRERELARWLDQLEQILQNGRDCLARMSRSRSHFAPVYFSRAQFFREESKMWRQLQRPQREAAAFQQAKHDIQEALRLYPTKASLWAFAGTLADQEGDVASAYHNYHKALYLDDISLQLWVRIPSAVRQQALEYVVKATKK